MLGDTHHYDRTHLPFDDEDVADLVLREGARLLGTALTVRRRWRGVYADSPATDFVVAAPHPGVRAVSVTSGIGMTTGLGLAALGPRRAALTLFLPSTSHPLPGVPMRTLRTLGAASGALTLALALAACGEDEPTKAAADAVEVCPDGSLTLGVEPYEDPAKLIPAYQALVEGLGEELGCTIELQVSDTYVAEILAMQNGELDMGQFGPLGLRVRQPAGRRHRARGLRRRERRGRRRTRAASGSPRARRSRSSPT